MYRALAAAAALAAFGIGIGSANATIITYSLAVYTGSGMPPAGPYGTVQLNDHGGSNVEVTVSLASGEGMINSGAGAALTWALAGSPVVGITGLTFGFSVSHNGTSTGNLDGTGAWMYEIDCTNVLCGSGGSNPYTGTLDFTINNVTLGAFTFNGKTATGYYFASDICTRVGTRGCAGITGDIASDKLDPTPAPEPISLTLLGTGLLGLGIVRYRRT